MYALVAFAFKKAQKLLANFRPCGHESYFILAGKNRPQSGDPVIGRPVILALQHAWALFLCPSPASRSGAVPKEKTDGPKAATFGENINEGELLV
jgi:hypothetical protein